MGNVKTIGSALLGQLITVSKRLSARSGSFAIVGASNFCTTAIGVANLDSMLPTYESIQTAVQEMSRK
jgi:anti-anti-sigma regulatory factor